MSRHRRATFLRRKPVRAANLVALILFTEACLGASLWAWNALVPAMPR